MKFLKQFDKKPTKLFQFLFWNILFAGLPFSLLFGFLSLFGVVPVKFNEEEIYGFQALIVTILYTPFLAFMFAAVMWIYISIGNFFLRSFVKMFL